MNMEGEIFACQPSMLTGIEVKMLITQVCTNEGVGEKFRNGTYKNKAKENITTKNANLFSLNTVLYCGWGKEKGREGANTKMDMQTSGSRKKQQKPFDINPYC